MFIKSLKLKNFKCYSEEGIEFNVPDGTPGSGLNILVGENSSGKSSMMEAIYHLRNKSKKSMRRRTAKDGEDCYVEQTFVGKIDEAIDNFVDEKKRESMKKCMAEKDEERTLTVRRNCNGDKEAEKYLKVFKDGVEVKNPGGIDAPFQAFFQISNIWAHTSPEDESKFSATSICGVLLADISEKFRVGNKEQYQDFLEAFHKTFNDEKAGLQGDLNKVALQTQEVLTEQFGRATLSFKFETPDLSIFFKNVKIFVDDDELSEKGHGMQRAVILSLLQVYARRLIEIKQEDGTTKVKPHFLFIDEPEMGLHPQAQRKLFDALKVIASDHQVFISTHSENFIDPGLVSNIIRFEKQEDEVKTYSGRGIDIDLRANRNFFLHHHRLFFSKRTIFVEGAEDLARYSAFCEQHDRKDLLKDLYFMGGYPRVGIYQDVCSGFNIPMTAVLDLDVISKSSKILKRFPADVVAAIGSLNKEITKGDPSNLYDTNLTETEKELKVSIIASLRGVNMFVLSEGAVEQYVDEQGNVVDASDAKTEELKAIFSLGV